MPGGHLRSDFTVYWFNSLNFVFRLFDNSRMLTVELKFKLFGIDRCLETSAAESFIAEATRKCRARSTSWEKSTGFSRQMIE